MGDLALVEEARQVGLHLGPSGDAQAHGEEAPQVLLHEGAVASVQALLPGFLGTMALL